MTPKESTSMERLYRAVLYPALLQRMDPVRAHHLALRLLRDADRMPGGAAILGRLAGPIDERLRVERFGLTFRNPLGGAAGLDEDAQAVGALLAHGYDAVEVGTGTPRQQTSNPQSRLWRLPQD